MESTESLCTSHPPAHLPPGGVLRDGSLNDKGRSGSGLPMKSNPNWAWLCCSKTKSSKAVSSQKVALTPPLKPGSPTHPPHSTRSSGSCLKDVTPAGNVTVCEVRAVDEQPPWCLALTPGYISAAAFFFFFLEPLGSSPDAGPSLL